MTFGAPSEPAGVGARRHVVRLPTGTENPSMTPAPGPDQLVQIYTSMLRIRRFEERARELYQAGRIPGFIHLSIGQEAVAVGVCAALRRDDYVLSTHRGHGHFLAKGGSARALMAELYGRSTGCCKGKGGSMHIADASVGYLGANGVLTSGCVLAPGVGLSIRMRKTDQVVVALFGDGAANRGPFHEGVNLAALWRAPVVFVCENNFWASTTAHDASTAGGSVAARAAGYGIPGRAVDGNDVLATHAALVEAVGRARQGQGPALIEAGLLNDAEARRIADGVEAETQDAIDFAESSPWPESHAALEDLFVHYPWRD